MLPAPIWPLAQHAEFGQNCFDASIGSVCFSIVYSMPMNASFFKSSFSFHRLVGFYRSSSNLSEMRLFDIINICKGEGILTNKSANLAHVIREYRNLIHPEKLRRLEETADKNGE